jgi:glycosyltransferase involved in cell wall biosynthesis
MLLSIGSAWKYKPFREMNVIKTSVEIINRYKNEHMYVIGLGRDHACPFGIFAAHDRLHFLGPREEPRLYQLAADIYLEAFPFGSQTALLETAMSGVPPVLAYSPLLDLLTTSDESLSPYVCNPVSEAEYIARACALIECPAERAELGLLIRKRILADHTGEGWLAGLPHQAGELQ